MPTPPRVCARSSVNRRVFVPARSMANTPGEAVLPKSKVAADLWVPRTMDLQLHAAIPTARATVAPAFLDRGINVTAGLYHAVTTPSTKTT